MSYRPDRTHPERPLALANMTTPTATPRARATTSSKTWPEFPSARSSTAGNRVAGRRTEIFEEGDHVLPARVGTSPRRSTPARAWRRGRLVLRAPARRADGYVASRSSTPDARSARSAAIRRAGPGRRYEGRPRWLIHPNSRRTTLGSCCSPGLPRRPLEGVERRARRRCSPRRADRSAPAGPIRRDGSKDVAPATATRSHRDAAGPGTGRDDWAAPCGGHRLPGRYAGVRGEPVAQRRDRRIAREHSRAAREVLRQYSPRRLGGRDRRSPMNRAKSRG